MQKPHAERIEALEARVTELEADRACFLTTIADLRSELHSLYDHVNALAARMMPTTYVVAAESPPVTVVATSSPVQP